MSAIPFNGDFRGLPLDNTNAPVGRWLFDTNSNDGSGNGYNLTLNQGTAYYAVNSILPANVGLSYEGYAAYAPFDTRYGITQAALSLNGDMSITFLVLRMDDSTGAFQCFIQCGTSPNIIYRVGWTTRGVGFFWQPNGVPAGVNGATSLAGPRLYGWTAITVTRDNDGAGNATGAAWINGVKVDQRTVAEPIQTAGTQQLHVFNDSSLSQEFVGMCAGIAIYNTVLSDAAIIAQHRRMVPMYVDQDA